MFSNINAYRYLFRAVFHFNTHWSQNMVVRKANRYLFCAVFGFNIHLSWIIQITTVLHVLLSISEVLIIFFLSYFILTQVASSMCELANRCLKIILKSLSISFYFIFIFLLLIFLAPPLHSHIDTTFVYFMIYQSVEFCYTTYSY